MCGFDGDNRHLSLLFVEYFNCIGCFEMKSQLCLKIWIMVLLALVVSKMSLSLYGGTINPDANYYIGVSRFLMDGKVPFLDFHLGYTPLSFYIMCIPFSIFGVSFTTALAVLYLFHIINAFWVYKICCQYSENQWLSVFTAGLSLMLCLICDGGSYVLEPFVLFFGLPAIYILKTESIKKILLSGFLCFCAFWCKQYGLGFICLAMSFLCLYHSIGMPLIGKLIYLLLGFVAGVVIFVTLFRIKGVDPLVMLSLSGGDYRREGMQGFIDAWRTLFIITPLLILPIILVVTGLKEIRKHSLLYISFCGVFGFMLQCYVRFYGHYMILVMPFCVLMLFACVKAFPSLRYRNIFFILLLLAPVIPTYFTIKDIVGLLNNDGRAIQEQSAHMIEKLIPKGADGVFASSDMLPVVLLNTYNPPLEQKFGLSNGFVTNPDEVYEMIQASSYCIISENRLETSQFSIAARDYLENEFDMKVLTSPDSQARYLIYFNKGVGK